LGILRDDFSAGQSKIFQPRIAFGNHFFPVFLRGIVQGHGQQAPVRGLPVCFQIQRVTRNFALEAGINRFDDWRDGATVREVLEIDFGLFARRTIENHQQQVAAIFGNIHGQNLVGSIAAAENFLVLFGVGSHGVVIGARAGVCQFRVIKSGLITFECSSREITRTRKGIWNFLSRFGIDQMDGDFVFAAFADAVGDQFSIVGITFKIHAGGVVRAERRGIDEHFLGSSGAPVHVQNK